MALRRSHGPVVTDRRDTGRSFAPHSDHAFAWRPIKCAVFGWGVVHRGARSATLKNTGPRHLPGD